MFKTMIARLFMWIMGWTVEGPGVSHDKCVIIAAPHTSNWDFSFFLACSRMLAMKSNWMGKHTMFKWPWGWFLRRTGGIPIIRHQKSNIVDSMAAGFKDHEKLLLVIPAEGTRSFRDYWKSGFYHIAAKARVPIVCSYLDYSKKRAGIGVSVLPSGNIRADMDKIRAFYKDIKGKFPENFSTIRLREEEEIGATG